MLLITITWCWKWIMIRIFSLNTPWHLELQHACGWSLGGLYEGDVWGKGQDWRNTGRNLGKLSEFHTQIRIYLDDLCKKKKKKASEKSRRLITLNNSHKDPDGIVLVPVTDVCGRGKGISFWSISVCVLLIFVYIIWIFWPIVD